MMIRAYLDLLIVSETGGEAIMALLTLEDAVVVKETFSVFLPTQPTRLPPED